MAQTHTPPCLERQQSYAQAVAVFERHYPHYCRDCGGMGGQAYWESPDGGPGRLAWFELCLSCEGAEDLATCGLCGQIMTEEGHRLCVCPLDTGMPASPECFCWDDTIAS